MCRRNTVRIMSCASNHKDHIDIYLAFSGQEEYLMTHRANPLLMRILKDGIYLDELERIAKNPVRYSKKLNHFKGHKRQKQSIENVVKHLIKVIDSYLEEREFDADYDLVKDAA